MVPVHDYLDRIPAHALRRPAAAHRHGAHPHPAAPRVIVADEPVSMIDLSTRAEILHLMKTIQPEMEMSLLYITARHLHRPLLRAQDRRHVPGQDRGDRAGRTR